MTSPTSLVANTAEEKRTPTHLPWRVYGTSIHFADVAGGFDVRNCPDPENLAAFIHRACNSFDALTEANAKLRSALIDALKEIHHPGYLRNAGKQQAPSQWESLLNATGAK